MMATSDKTYFLAPSDLSFLYDRCPRCYWLKLKGIVGPSDVLPGIFREIDSQQKSGITLELIRKLGIPAAEFIPREKVTGEPIEYGGVRLAISGYTDRRVRLDDGTVGVLDYKTSNPRKDNIVKYWRSMSGYQHAIENSSQPEEVTLLALIVFTPTGFKLRPEATNQAFYIGEMQRLDIEINRTKFETLLTGIGNLLAREEMPPAGSCDVCRHADQVVGMRMQKLLDQVAGIPELGPDVAALMAARVQL